VKLWTNACKSAAYGFFASGGYRVKSSFHRVLFDRQYQSTQVPVFDRLEQHVSWIRNFKWKADGITEFFDSVCTPNKVAAVGMGSSPHGNDCDEAAILNVAVINGSIRAGKMLSEGIKTSYFLTVMWIQGWKTNGHNVALLEYPVPNGPQWAFMDYGAPSPRRGSIQDVVNDVRTAYAKDAQPLVWCQSDENLNPKHVEWEK
jgi:hypothetical protein